MQRVFGALAAFAGWISILVSAAAGLLASEMLGLDHTEGALPPSAVYGVPEVVVLWILLGTALLALVPIGAAMVSDKPGPSLSVAAILMAAAGMALLPDDLGRVHGLIFLAGAGAFAAAAYLRAESTAARAARAAGEDETPAEAPQAVAPEAPAPVTGAPPTPAAAKASARARRGATHICPWCSGTYRAGAATCGSCGAALVARPELSEEAIPGVTVVSPELLDHRTPHPIKKPRASLLSMMMGGKDDRILDPAASPAVDGDVDAFRPPSDEVRLEMARLEREIAAGAAAHELALKGTPAELPAEESAGPPD